MLKVHQMFVDTHLFCFAINDKYMTRKEKKPAAQVIRKLLVEGINKKHKETAGAAMSRLAALKVKVGSADLSINLDKYLYE